VDGNFTGFRTENIRKGCSRTSANLHVQSAPRSPAHHHVVPRNGAPTASTRERHSLNETNSSNNRAVLTFPSWVPAAVKWQAEQLYAELAMHPDPAKAKQILARLASDPLMESLWHELFRKNRQSGEFFNPAMTAARRAAKSDTTRATATNIETIRSRTSPSSQQRACSGADGYPTASCFLLVCH
jgi:hypothetical protein